MEENNDKYWLIAIVFAIIGTVIGYCFPNRIDSFYGLFIGTFFGIGFVKTLLYLKEKK